MNYAEVFVEHEAMSLNHPFTYSSEEPLTRGCRVKVPFGRQMLQGLVVRVLDQKPETDWKIKTIEKIIDQEPLLNSELFELAEYLSETTVSSLMSVYKSMLPSAYKPATTASKEVFDTWLVRRKPEVMPELTKKQKELYETLPAEILRADARKKYSVSILGKLQEKGLLQPEKRIRQYDLARERQKKEPPELKVQQSWALEEIRSFQAADPKPVLLHGVTGSGKTEVFFRLAADALDQGKSVLLLVPEIGLAPQMIARVKERFDVPVIVFHSRLSDAEAASEYRKCAAMEKGIVIGTRKAVFLPFQNLGLIVVDEEHDSSYKQDNTPKYHARDAAIWRGNYWKCPVILASATPSLDSYARAAKGVYNLVTMDKRIADHFPPVQLIDMKTERTVGGLSATLIRAIQKRLDKKEKVILLLNRRGFIPVMKCTGCQEPVLCEDCGIPLSYHKKENALVCHICNRHFPVPAACPNCGSDKWSLTGLGTERLEANLRELFPKAKLVRMDADSTRFRNSHETLLNEFEEDGDILLGTQMVAKGLDYETVTLVGILQADAALQRADYRAAEMTYQMLEQASGRAGRGRYEGEVLVQTWNPDHYVFQSIVRHSYRSFFNREMHYRHVGSYPPYVYMASLVFVSEDGALAYRLAEECQKRLQSENLLVYGPLELSMRIKKSRFRLLMKDKSLDRIQKACWDAANRHHASHPKVRLEVNINPVILEE